MTDEFLRLANQMLYTKNKHHDIVISGIRLNSKLENIGE